MPDTEHLERNPAAVCDRRAYARRPVPSFAYIELGENNGGVVRDVSQDGLAVQSAEPLAEGQTLSLRFRLPNTGIWLQAIGRVAWQSKSARAGGIQFVDLPEAAKADIDLWISSGGKSVGGRRGRSRISAPAQSPSAAIPRSNVTTASDTPDTNTHDTKRPSIPSHEESANWPQTAMQPNGFGPTEPDSNTPRRQVRPDRPARAVRADSYHEPRDSRSRIPTPYFPEVDLVEKKPRRWGTVAAVGVAVAVMLGLGATLAPQNLRDNAVQQVTAFVSRYTANLTNSQGGPQAGTNAAATSSTTTAPVPLTSGDTDRNLPAHQDPASALPLNNSKPLELQSQETAPTPDVAESAPQKSSLSVAAARNKPASKPFAAKKQQELEARRFQDENKRKGAGAITARKRREIPQSRAPQNARISPHSLPGRPQLRTVAVTSAEYVPGSYSSDGFLDLPETPVSASSEFAITTRRTIPLRYPAGAQPAYSGQSLKIGSLVYHVDPIYPDEALRDHVQGLVELHVTVGTDGNVEGVEPVSGPIALIPAAMGAVRQWQYGRTLHYGQPVPTEADIDILFRLP